MRDTQRLVAQRLVAQRESFNWAKLLASSVGTGKNFIFWPPTQHCARLLLAATTCSHSGSSPEVCGLLACTPLGLAGGLPGALTTGRRLHQKPWPEDSTPVTIHTHLGASSPLSPPPFSLSHFLAPFSTSFFSLFSHFFHFFHFFTLFSLSLTPFLPPSSARVSWRHSQARGHTQGPERPAGVASRSLLPAGLVGCPLAAVWSPSGRPLAAGACQAGSGGGARSVGYCLRWWPLAARAFLCRRVCAVVRVRVRRPVRSARAFWGLLAQEWRSPQRKQQLSANCVALWARSELFAHPAKL